MYLRDYLTFSLNFSDFSDLKAVGRQREGKEEKWKKIKRVEILKGAARFELSVKQAYAL